ncbi:MerR family transcriptional regulator [Lactonifactor longoviformis]|uniref:MerR family transcriptional regulator n=1 Tax=Lactonifactor longoviformis TaxID=341220 RepID=UPI001D020448|nr:MerR family transcriptional regulator [Lactonifactor longoviformis]MCB5714582.1 MerR family transcriptional regulator [Lactonifactor longoviformis]MCB5718536.1 MerR family transcriptional regulator [Lactonifactor longoviformis]
MNPQKQLFTAGEFARLTGVNKRTLHYYDEIGLFSPAQKGSNGYRYYTYEQSLTLEMLLALREAGMSINEIRHYMDHRSARLFHEMVRQKTSEIDAFVRRLKAIKEILEEKDKMLSLSESAKLNQITIKDCPEEYLALSPAVSDSEQEMDALIRHMKEVTAYTPYRKSFGSMLSAEKIQEGNYTDYDYLFTRISRPKTKKGLYKKPKGRYLQAFCKGSWDDIPSVYQKLMSYADSHGLLLRGYSYEIGLNEMAITRMDEYVTLISILCTERMDA